MKKLIFLTAILIVLSQVYSKNVITPPYKGEKTAMFNQDIIDIAKKNTNFRKEIITGKNSQVVVMSIPVGGDIGQETHPSTDQTLFFVQGRGVAILNGQTGEIAPNHLVFVPAGTQHNFKNTGNEELKLITIYAPPQHKPGTVQKTKPQEQY